MSTLIFGNSLEVADRFMKMDHQMWCHEGARRNEQRRQVFMISGAVIVATNDVAGIYRANVGGCFSTQEIVIISRPVQLVLCR